MKNKEDLKILLLQIREDKETLIEEFLEFVSYSGLNEHNFTSLNAYEKHEFEHTIIDDYDALFIGGSSDATVLDKVEYPFNESCNRLIRYCYEENIPTFASCYGFQVAVDELGGKVIIDKANMEIGVLPISLTEEAQVDPVMKGMPSPFWAVSAHKDRASFLPKEAILLCYSELCPYHAFRFNNKPFYSFQFHPEVDRKDLIARITRYQERYLDNAEQLEEIKKNSIQDTPDSNSLVKRFVDVYLLGENI